MRARIAKTFATSSDPRLRAAAADVEFAPITTIHAFGARLLREHAVEAGVDPAFTLFDETEARLCLEDAWIDVERRLRRRPRSGAARPAAARRGGGLAGPARAPRPGARPGPRPPRPHVAARGGRPGDAARRRAPPPRGPRRAGGRRRQGEGRRAHEVRRGPGAIPRPVGACRSAPTCCGVLDPLARGAAARMLPAPARRRGDAPAGRPPRGAEGRRRGAPRRDGPARARGAPAPPPRRDGGRVRGAQARARGPRLHGPRGGDDPRSSATSPTRGRPLEGGPLRVLVDEFQDTNPLQAAAPAPAAPAPGRCPRRPLRGGRPEAVDLPLPPCRRGGHARRVGAGGRRGADRAVRVVPQPAGAGRVPRGAVPPSLRHGGRRRRAPGARREGDVPPERPDPPRDPDGRRRPGEGRRPARGRGARRGRVASARGSRTAPCARRSRRGATESRCPARAPCATTTSRCSCGRART